MAGRRGVTYVLNAEERKFVDGFRNAIVKAKQLETQTASGMKTTTRGFDAGTKGVRGFDRELGNARGKVGGLRGALLNMRGGVDKAVGPGAQKLVSGFAGAFVGTAGVTGAIKLATDSIETFRQNVREAAEETKKLADEVIAFSSIQDPGTLAERVNLASELATEFGITDRAAVLQTVQQLQSQKGRTFETGKAAAETVLRGTLVGIPIEKGTELEVQGASLGAAPGDTLRRAFAAGKLSPRDPATLAGAAPALKNFEDQDFAFAAAAVISGGVKPDELQTYLRQGGIGLSKDEIFKNLAGLQGFTGIGIPPSRVEVPESQEGRLQQLARAGIDTPKELERIGFTELRQRDAVAILAKNADDVARIKGEIIESAKPGVLARDRARIEEELPITRLRREAATLQSAAADEQAFGPSGLRGTELEIEERLRGLALRRMGIEQVGPFDLIDAEGRTRLRDLMKAQIFELFAPSGALGPRNLFRAVDIGTDAIRKELEAANQNVVDNTIETAAAAGTQTAALDRRLIHLPGIDDSTLAAARSLKSLEDLSRETVVVEGGPGPDAALPPARQSRIEPATIREIGMDPRVSEMLSGFFGGSPARPSRPDVGLNQRAAGALSGFFGGVPNLDALRGESRLRLDELGAMTNIPAGRRRAINFDADEGVFTNVRRRRSPLDIDGSGVLTNVPGSAPVAPGTGNAGADSAALRDAAQAQQRGAEAMQEAAKTLKQTAEALGQSGAATAGSAPPVRRPDVPRVAATEAE